MALLSNRHSSEVEICVLDRIMSTGSQIAQSREAPAQASRAPMNLNIAAKALRGEQLTREAILLMFCDPLPARCSRLLNLSERSWKTLLRWLDISGLALYFLDRLIELDLCELLPSSVFTRLYLNTIDNNARTRGMIQESIAIQQGFQDAGLSYAILKGLSLWPGSVPKPELRSQFDLDFLVAEKSARDARQILERRGYRLYAISGRSWEFKFNERPGLSLKHQYKNLPSFAVELHIEPTVRGGSSPLVRLELRELHGMKMPVLSPVDLLLGQGLHLFKHICGESVRTAHFLEFRRHVLSRRDDGAFWEELKLVANENPRASVGLGVVTLLITRVMGEFAPEALTNWSVETLSGPVRLWVETYGPRIVYSSYPGSKLYLLLQQELESTGIPGKRSVRDSLLPFRLPPTVIRAFPNEPLSVRIRRYYMQLELILARLRFHVVEGLRFKLESRRWRHMKELAQ
jgi:hypothetical protein